MRATRAVLIGLFSLTLALVGRANAQTCAGAVPINCGDTVQDDSGDGSNVLEDYSCETWTFVGRDFIYVLQLAQDSQVHINLQPDWGLFSAWDAGLMVLPEIDGDCYGAAASDCVDYAGSGSDEDLVTVLPAGTHYLVVDGYRSGDYGDFEILVECTPCDNCVDSDGDGYAAYSSSGCLCGSDCDDADPLINPSTPEICADGVDQNCDGDDPACPNCAVNSVVTCGDAGSADSNDGSSNLNRYCGTAESHWDTREYIFALSNGADTFFDVQISNFGGLQLDAFAFRDYGVYGVCNKDACLDRSSNDGGDEHLAFLAEADQTYFVAVDGRDSDRGSFDYTFACLSESCEPTEQLGCGFDGPGNSSGGINNVSAYAGLDHHLFGPELVYTFSNPSDARVTLVMYVDVPGLDLMVIEDDGGGSCLPGNLIAYSARSQTQASRPPEILDFHAAGGVTYYVVVDGREAGDAGTFNLRADCVIECPPELTECNGACVDLTSDPEHCGGCETACFFPHAAALCADSACLLGECDPLWGDCNQDDSDGCESDFNTDQDCGACGQSCAFDHAAGWCEDGHCVMGACDDDWDNCNDLTQDGCEAYLLSAENCGVCFNFCTIDQVCHLGECLDSCPDGMADCDGACVDVTSNLQHCGGCDAVCSVPNGLPVCSDGTCLILDCNPGMQDCNQDAADGCETELGTILDCSVCGDHCQYPNASGICDAGLCVMGACDLDFGNCNDLTSDGCEAEIASDHDNCGYCGRVCGVREDCLEGVCTLNCDADGDGHESEDCSGGDCDDLDENIHPEADDICGDGVDQDCQGGDEECNCFDTDGDGYIDATCGGDDCDDHNGFIYPGAPETCGDGIDQDCDEVDMPCVCADADNDGHRSESCGGKDCDDTNHQINPDAQEICGDGIDQDCKDGDKKCSGGCGCTQHRRFGSLALLISLLGILAINHRKPKES